MKKKIFIISALAFFVLAISLGEIFSAQERPGNVNGTGESYGGETNRDHATIKYKECPPGDMNNDGVVNLNDIIYLLNYLLKCGDPPVCQPVEANGNCELDLGDVIYLIKYLYLGGPAPVPWCSDQDTYYDPGYPDTIRIATVSDSAGQTVDVPVYVYNDEAIYLIVPLKMDTTYM